MFEALLLIFIAKSFSGINVFEGWRFARIILLRNAMFTYARVKIVSQESMPARGYGLVQTVLEASVDMLVFPTLVNSEIKFSSKFLQGVIALQITFSGGMGH